MAAIKLSKAWSINPNVRNAYVSLADMAGWWIYEHHAFLITKNWTIKFTSDGVTADGNDNLPNKTAASVRGASAAAPQSFTVLTNPDGVDLLITYQGATDDVIKLAYSPGGLYVLAGTPTHQPTATDEQAWMTGNSVINATTSLDRVMTIWASDDGKAFSNITWRNGVHQGTIGLERVVSACTALTFAKPYIAYRYTAYDRSQAPGGTGPTYDIQSGITPGAAGFLGALARVFTNGAARTTRVGAGTVSPQCLSGASLSAEEIFISNTPALQNGTMPLLPLFLGGEKTANLDGFLGQPMDWWVGYSASLSVPAFHDFFPGYDPGDVVGVDPERTNWFIAIGSTMIRPWRDAAATMQTA